MHLKLVNGPVQSIFIRISSILASFVASIVILQLGVRQSMWYAMEMPYFLCTSVEHITIDR